MSVLSHCDPTKVNRVLAGKKFDVKHLTVDEVKSQYVQNPPFPVVNIVKQGILVAAQSPERWGFADANLNRLCPDVEPINIEEFLKKRWGKA